MRQDLFEYVNAWSEAEDEFADLIHIALLAGQIEVEDYMLAICWLSANHQREH